jgi:hypothetical protein
VIELASANDRCWHFPEVPAPPVYVGYWGKTGRHLLAMSSSQFEPDCDIDRLNLL